MSTPKHTPGPWKISEDQSVITGGDGKYSLVSIAETPVAKWFMSIARVSQDTTLCDREKEESLSFCKRAADVALANTNLIAAAPELLRELKAAIFYIETYGGEVTSSFASGGNLAQIKAIIAKAEGGGK